MPSAKTENQKQSLLDLLELSGICVYCESLTKLLVQKEIITWDELLAMAKPTNSERENCRRILTERP